MSLNWGRQQWKALAIQWTTGRVSDEQQLELLDKMSRQERRRFEKLCEQAQDKKLHDAESYVTKRQMAQYFEVHIEQHHMPLAANLDDVTKVVMYLAKPWYERLWIMVRVWWDDVTQWLARRGIRFVELRQEEVDDVGSDVHGDVGAQRGERPGREAADPDVRDGRSGDRADGGEERAGGDQPEGSLTGEPEQGEVEDTEGVAHIDRRAGRGLAVD